MFTEREQNLLHRKVQAVRPIPYGGKIGTIPKGFQGVIVDFASSSGDPVICWDYSHQLTITPIEILLVVDVKIPDYKAPSDPAL